MGERLAEEVYLLSTLPLSLILDSCNLHRCLNKHALFRWNLIHETLFINQVRQVVQRRRNLRKISFVAHSLGGLISRYAIGKLYEHSIGEEPHLIMDKHSDEENMYGSGKLAGLEPMNFITSATPHLGSRCNKQVRSRTILCAAVGTTNTNLSVGGKIDVYY
jgi:triacylglycerol esterase/lipase EstA (alpha/beta hydrolase family)